MPKAARHVARSGGPGAQRRDCDGQPIIYLTAHVLQEDVVKARNAGCDAYETKPVVYQRLMKKIESLVKR